jgi:hypothetical protein
LDIRHVLDAMANGQLTSRRVFLRSARHGIHGHGLCGNRDVVVEAKDIASLSSARCSGGSGRSRSRPADGPWRHETVGAKAGRNTGEVSETSRGSRPSAAIRVAVASVMMLQSGRQGDSITRYPGSVGYC